MTDLDPFDVRLEARLVAHAATARPLHDPGTVARAAIERAGSGHGWRPVAGRGSTRASALAIAATLALLAILGYSALVGGTLRRSTPLPSPQAIAPSPQAIAPSPLASLQPETPAPLAGTFSATGRLAFARYQHVALLLADGRVLVLGTGANDLAPPAEIYDPASGQFSTVDVEPLRRREDDRDAFSATVLEDGLVLIAGGQRPPVDLNNHSTVRDDAYLFDPVDGTVESVGPMSASRSGHVAVLLDDGRVLLAGGLRGEGPLRSASQAAAEVFDPATRSFIAVGPMTTDRTRSVDADLVALKLPSGRVLVHGGRHVVDDAAAMILEESDAEATDEVFVPGPDEFRPGPPGVEAGDPAAITFLDGDRILRYDLATGVATDMTPEDPALVREYGVHCPKLPFGCSGGWTAAGLGDGRFLLVGGFDGLPGRKPGGDWGDTRTTAEVVDPLTGTSVRTGPTLEVRRAHTVTLLADGRALVIGGLPGMQSAEIFTPLP
jgi:hypothetical protein